MLAENHGVTDTFKRYIISAHNKGVEINEKYRVVETGQELATKAGEKAKVIAYGIDEKYHVKDKMVVAKEGAQVRSHFPCLFERKFNLLLDFLKSSNFLTYFLFSGLIL